jgi:DNA-binding SARP family transcriptional activator
MRFELLGRLRVVTESGPATVSAPKVETMLAVLLIRAGQVSSTAQLAYEIWGDRPPRRFIASVHVYVHHVRKALAEWSGVPDAVQDQRLSTRRDGYVLTTGLGELDADDFRELLAEGRARAAAGFHADASRSLARALVLWRGPALAGLTGGPIVNEFVRWSGEARLECEALRVEQEFALGCYEEQIAPLRELTSAHPLREDFARQLMLALHRAGRSSEALSTYRHVSRVIERELGLEPGRALRELYTEVLTADRAQVGA